MTQQEDRELVDRCIAGEEEAWRAFVVRYTPIVTGAVRRVLGPGEGDPDDPDRVQEVVSMLFERLLEDQFRRLREFRWGCSLVTWLHVTASRLTLNHLRDRRFKQRQSAEYRQLLAALEGAVSPLSAVEQQERREWLEKGLARLSPRERRVFLGFHLQEHSYRDLSRTEGIPMGSLTACLLSAKKKLLSFLKGKLGLFLL